MTNENDGTAVAAAWVRPPEWLTDRPSVTAAHRIGTREEWCTARLELLKLMSKNETLRVRVAENYHDVDAISAADFLVTYTCNLVPTVEEQLPRYMDQFIVNVEEEVARFG